MHYVLIMSGEEVLYQEWEYLMLRLLLSGGCLRGLQRWISIWSDSLSFTLLLSFAGFFFAIVCSLSFPPTTSHSEFKFIKHGVITR